ncbi:hypothetical protein P8452_67341 [Trifolium repens]|nr:hypothetical protein P8452_67341 [Trifolium repens]
MVLPLSHSLKFDHHNHRRFLKTLKLLFLLQAVSCFSLISPQNRSRRFSLQKIMISIGLFLLRRLTIRSEDENRNKMIYDKVVFIKVVLMESIMQLRASTIWSR